MIRDPRASGIEHAFVLKLGAEPDDRCLSVGPSWAAEGYGTYWSTLGDATDLLSRLLTKVTGIWLDARRVDAVIICDDDILAPSNEYAFTSPRAIQRRRIVDTLGAFGLGHAAIFNVGYNACANLTSAFQIADSLVATEAFSAVLVVALSSIPAALPRENTEHAWAGDGAGCALITASASTRFQCITGVNVIRSAGSGGELSTAGRALSLLSSARALKQAFAAAGGDPLFNYLHVHGDNLSNGFYRVFAEALGVPDRKLMLTHRRDVGHVQAVDGLEYLAGFLERPLRASFLYFNPSPIRWGIFSLIGPEERPDR